MFYKYRVSFYNSYEDKEQYDEGIVVGHDYGAAANNVINTYDKISVIDIYLKEISDEDEYCLSKEELEIAFRKE